MEPTKKQADFASVLFDRVGDYLEQKSVRMRGEMIMLLKAVMILVLYGWTYAQWLTASDSFSAMAGFAVLLGICHVLIPVNISHDGIHRAFSRNHLLNQLAILSMNLTGASAFMFKKMHLKAHEDKENGSRHEAIETQNLLMKNADQKNVPVILYLFYALYMAFIRDFTLFYKERDNLSAASWGWMILGKFAYFIAIWILPFWLIPLPAWQICIGIFFIYLVVALLAIIILLMPTEPLEVSRGGQDQTPSNIWVEEILIHNVDFSPDSQALNFICGGANMNVVHYLFPHVSHIHYVNIAKIMKETTSEFGMVYRTQSVWKVPGIHLKYMLNLKHD